MTLFKAMFGYEPRHWGITAEGTCSVPALQSWLDERATVQALLQQHLNRAQQLMKDQADKKRSFRTFVVGDTVYLKLQPYIQSSVASRANQKLAYKFYGPFPIIDKINEVAYKLQLPPQATVHPVFHVSLPRQALLPGTSAETHLPHCLDDLAVPEAVLQTRWRKYIDGVREQVKIQWSASSNLGITWEDKASLMARFPHVEAWGQASSEGGGDVSTPDNGDP
ncbi:uncharacterized protein [Aegilops tauschii subsp. strangulata]|uniref:uncharacterized protein n=1 Tax=Aegilops tauschii subsp. strangulata TaxID=200361 RepID=UPI00098AF08F|nr:uncharacterized protein LOC109732703 [Aegilops tauschii subsp. strangulata]